MQGFTQRTIRRCGHDFAFREKTLTPNFVIAFGAHVNRQSESAQDVVSRPKYRIRLSAVLRIWVLNNGDRQNSTLAPCLTNGGSTWNLTSPTSIRKFESDASVGSRAAMDGLNGVVM